MVSDLGAVREHSRMVHLLGLAAIGTAAALALGAVASAPEPATPPARLEFVLPVAGSALVHPFRAPAQPWAPGHRGVDLTCAVGQDVLAPADGTVAFVGTVVDRSVVTIAHPDGLLSSLEPVLGSVDPGARVLRGQVVGTLQAVAGHCAPASCLHWGVRRTDRYVDPMELLAGPVILLPDR